MRESTRSGSLLIMTRQEKLLALASAAVLATGGIAVTRWPTAATEPALHQLPIARPQAPSPTPLPTLGAPKTPLPAPAGVTPATLRRRSHDHTHAQLPPRLDRDTLDATTAVVPAELHVRTGSTFTLAVHGRSSHNLLPGYTWSDGTTQTFIAIDCGFRPPPPAPHLTATPSPTSTPGPLGGLPLPSPSPSPASSQAPSPTPTPAGSPPPAQPYAFSDQHAYRYPGVYYALVRLQAVCDRSSGSVTRAVRITVTGPADHSNGPQLPQPALYPGTAEHPDDPSWFFGYANDNDGWIRELRVHWGDGTPDTVYRYPTSKCHDPAWTWPTDTGSGFDVQHRWAHAGPHSVQLQVTSTGCDGHSPQHADITLHT
jgi:hypothetical protein